MTSGLGTRVQEVEDGTDELLGLFDLGEVAGARNRDELRVRQRLFQALRELLAVMK
jgi:hypothetical protein